MEINKPLSRSEYNKHLEALNGECVFCNMSDGLTINNYDLWTWAFAAFPYRKQHTLIIPKRHILKFSELETDEIIELKQIIKEAEDRYKNSSVVSSSSSFGDQLFFSWRSRQNNIKKKSVSHYHIHVYPKFGSADDMPLDAESHKIDMDILKK